MTQRMSIVFTKCSIEIYYTKRSGGRSREVREWQRMCWWLSVSSSNFYLPLRVARPAWQDPCNFLSLTEWLALAYCRPLSDPGLTAPLSNLNRPCRFKSADSESASPHPQAATASLTRRVWHTQWRTRTRMPLAVGVSACPSLRPPPPPARICQYMPVYASICKYMHVYARMCRWSGQKTTKCEKHVCARICTYMHVYECIWKYDGIRYRKCPFSVSPPVTVVTVGCTHDVSSWLGWSATAV